MSRSKKARYGLRPRCSTSKDAVLASRSQKRAWSKRKQIRSQQERTRAKATLRGEPQSAAASSVTWSSGDGGGAIEVVLDANGKAFGFICDDSEGFVSASGVHHVEHYKWWVRGGPSGGDPDYRTARAALGRAAEEHAAKVSA